MRKRLLELKTLHWWTGWMALIPIRSPGGCYVRTASSPSRTLPGRCTCSACNELPASSYQSLSECLPMMRAVKDSNELMRLAAAAAAADSAYGQIVQRRFEGRREIDVAADLADLLRDFGHEEVDLPIVGSGPNGANPHHEAGDRVIKNGDPVVMDFGGLRFGYGSDTTRTVCVGEPTPEVRAVHEVVRRAQQAGVDAVRPGVSCQDIDRVARRVIAAAGYGERFIHRTGHGIGVTTHEPPYLVEGEEQLLVPGMCFSVEPGIYLTGRFGIRIEDIVTVTADGCQRLNNPTMDCSWSSSSCVLCEVCNLGLMRLGGSTDEPFD